MPSLVFLLRMLLSDWLLATLIDICSLFGFIPLFDLSCLFHLASSYMFIKLETTRTKVRLHLYFYEDLQLHNVLHGPYFHANLLSVPQLTKFSKCHAVFDHNSSFFP